MKKANNKDSTIAKNRKAYHDYSISETFEAGLVLTGTEVRSLREGGGQLTDTFVLVRRGEAWLHGLHIKPYSHGSRANQDPDRVRKLLLHKKQIRYLSQKTAEKGMALVPLTLYFSDTGRVKVLLGLAKGKKDYDKRQTQAERESKREIERAIKSQLRL
ncbi:MAG: SsrA-binding protein SmpB [Coriobacteriales bacterium]|nr:SsrA-binding protein SmpB [Coriobacteriales bacterium]